MSDQDEPRCSCYWRWNGQAFESQRVQTAPDCPFHGDEAKP